MPHTAKPAAQFSGIRLIGGALAFLLLCGTALLGGAQTSKVAPSGFWHAGTKAPLVDVISYPKDCQRSGESRWRFSSEGDDQPDQPFALEGYPQPLLGTEQHSSPRQPNLSPLSALLHHRPQAARAPPLA
jgi:hypothetical protein